MTIVADPRYNPFPLYARMRATSPVSFHPEQSTWLVYGYDDIRTIVNDPVTFSSRVLRGVPGREGRQPFVIEDAPYHTQMRNLVSRAFTPTVIAELEPRIEEITHQLLDHVIEAGQMDLIGDFGIPLPVTVIAEMLGVPSSDYRKFKEWSDLVILGGEEMTKGLAPAPHMVQAERDLSRYLESIIQARRAHPHSDMISSLVAVNIDGEHLSTQEIVETAKLMLVAGNETTTNLIGNAIVTLLEHPASLARLKAEPELVPSAIEEVLRYRPSTQYMVRLATRDVELGGRLVEAGQRILAFVGSGNRDGTAFPDPDRFDVARSPNRHLAFGHGIHFCLGAPLARLEGKVALAAIFQRLSELRLAEGDAIEILPSKMIFGLKRLNVRFTPGAKVSR